jgi:hypothetical protein
LELEKWFRQGYDGLNIGGGPKNLAGFVNIDFVDYPNVDRAIIADITDLSFVPDGCVSRIHSNHVIEHLSGEQLHRQFSEYFRILKSNGRITLRCPNALGAAYGFWHEPILEDGREEFVSLGFPKDEDFGNSADGWMHEDLFGLLHWFYGDVGNPQNEHLSLITPSKIVNYLKSAGFAVEKMTEPEAVNIVVIARKK